MSWNLLQEAVPEKVLEIEIETARGELSLVVQRTPTDRKRMYLAVISPRPLSATSNDDNATLIILVSQYRCFYD